VTRHVIIDTGPLVALIDRRDRFHEWAKAQTGAIATPLVTSEIVFGEACYLLRGLPRGVRELLNWLEIGLVVTSFRLDQESHAVSDLMTRYSSVPMSLADACLVRMSELYMDSVVMTLDSDFRIYRQHGRRVIPTIMPDEASELS